MIIIEFPRVSIGRHGGSGKNKPRHEATKIIGSRLP